MADVPKPPRKIQGKGLPPQQIESSTNLSKSNEGDAVSLTFKVPKEFKKDFRGIAYDEEISMTELLKKSFELYRKAKYGIQ